MANGVQGKPLIIFGLDGGDPGLIQKWAQEGYLPTIASIMQRGCWGPLAGPDMIFEHGVWVSVVSGISRSTHGYYDYRQLHPGTYDLGLVSGRDAMTRPFWRYLQGTAARIAVMDISDSFCIPGLAGIQIADWAVHNPLFPPSTEPADLIREVQRIFGSQRIVLETLDGDLGQERCIYRALLERVDRKGKLCRELLVREPYDLIFINFAEAHTGGHQFWKYRPEARRDDIVSDAEDLTHAIRDIYQAIDRQIGALLATLPTEANIFIIGLVGIRDEYPTFGLTEALCRRLGYQAAPGTAPVSMSPLSVARRLLPEAWRVTLSRYFPRATRERLLADQFRSSTDWQRTRTFALPSVYTGCLRVNLVGRDPQGIVKPGADYNELLEQLTDDFRALVDADTGVPAVERVARADDLFGANRHAALPDLIVEWRASDRFLTRVRHPRAVLTQAKPEFFRGTDHSATGFVAATGPAVHARGALDGINLLDLAPTFLHLLGVPVPDELAGKVLETMATA